MRQRKCEIAETFEYMSKEKGEKVKIMYKVELYMENTGKSPAARKEWYGYILICAQLPEHTRKICEEFEGTKNQRDLVMLQSALKRCNRCRLIVHTDSQYLVGGYYRMGKYLKNGWKNAKGEEIKNKELWQQVHELIVEKGIQIEFILGKHDRTSWLQTEIKVARRNQNV